MMIAAKPLIGAPSTASSWDAIAWAIQKETAADAYCEVSSGGALGQSESLATAAHLKDVLRLGWEYPWRGRRVASAAGFSARCARRCSDCGRKFWPHSYHRIQTIRSALGQRFTAGQWLPGLTRQVGGHWARAPSRQVKSVWSW